jgi:1,4-dihydroxy-6-naphthoate synthase
MNTPLILGISPCPNDTFIFEAWINGRLGPDAPAIEARLEDIDTLNRMALQGVFDVVKISFYAYGLLRNSYQLLQAGGALGRGCGPLLVCSKPEMIRHRLSDGTARVAVPGELTTGHLLLRLFAPALQSVHAIPFDRIMPAVSRGEFDAGVIIHEGRFTYPTHGLHLLADLGEWWERETGHPIPLGCIAARSNLAPEMIARLERTIRASLLHARSHPDDARDYIRSHAQEIDARVIAQHIDLYVNRFSEDYGAEGHTAIECLLERARTAGLFQQ